MKKYSENENFINIISGAIFVMLLPIMIFVILIESLLKIKARKLRD